jgi:hypothetical protein
MISANSAPAPAGTGSRLVRLVLAASSMFLAANASAQSAYTLEARTGSGPLVVERCAGGRCSPVRLPAQLRDEAAEGFEVSTDDIDGDGTREIVATGSGVNRCSSFYKYNAGSNSLAVYQPTKQSLCNYKSSGDQVFSSYREGATWFEEAYRKEKGRLVLVGRDRCVGCGEVYRTLYQNGRPAEKMVVSDEPTYLERKQRSTTVSSDKAVLYDGPAKSKPTKMYLIKGDPVALVDYDDSEEGWYQVRYLRKNKPDIVKWVQCRDLAICPAG